MITVYTDKHKLRDAKTELSGGELIAPVECPARAEAILASVRESKLGEVIDPESYSLDAVTKLHDPEYIQFLETAWSDWVEDGNRGEAMATSWAARGQLHRAPQSIVGKLGYYALAAETSITDGTWEAARAAADVSLTAQSNLANGARAAFALCRPPGHHAAKDLYGGYCFLNNAAIAAQAFLDQGSRRVAILDVDFHHGNGTQSLFYDRADVLFLSLHGDPAHAFPYYLGYSDEAGERPGEGANANYPLPPGTKYDEWGRALDHACNKILDYSPDALVVSLGVDTFKADPISFFALETEDYKVAGGRIGRLGIPTLFVMEGGYAVGEIGTNTVNVLLGFEGG
jgi:acetoin utilization deacetylase AcuC-like enzyme